MHPDGKEFVFKGGKEVVILIHGFSATTQEVWELGKHLHKEGFTVVAPLLSGHDIKHKPQQFKHVRSRHMYNSILSAYEKVHNRHVNIVGFSFGAMLGLKLAIDYPNIKKIVAISPAVKFVSKLMWAIYPISQFNIKHYKTIVKSKHADKESIYDIWDKKAILDREGFSYRYLYPRPVHSMKVFVNKVMKSVHRIKNPILIMHSTKDRTVSEKGAQKLYARVGTPSDQKHFVPLHNCGHVITVDNEKETVFKDVSEFLK